MQIKINKKSKKQYTYLLFVQLLFVILSLLVNVESALVPGLTFALITCACILAIFESAHKSIVWCIMVILFSRVTVFALPIALNIYRVIFNGTPKKINKTKKVNTISGMIFSFLCLIISVSLLYVTFGATYDSSGNVSEVYFKTLTFTGALTFGLFSSTSLAFYEFRRQETFAFNLLFGTLSFGVGTLYLYIQNIIKKV